MFRWIRGKIKNLYEKIRFRIKLKRMDDLWYMFGGSCFGLFPPSFYYTHTPEEVDRIAKEEIAKLRKIADDFAKKHGIDTDQSTGH